MFNNLKYNQLRLWHCLFLFVGLLANLWMSYKYSAIGGSDFDIDLEAARFLSSGVSAYSGPNTHPPFSLIFALPFLHLKAQSAFLLYNLISLGVYCIGCGLVLSGLVLSLDWKVLLLGTSLILPTQLAGIALASVSPLLSGLILIAWYFLQSKRTAVAEFLLAVAFLLKLYPGFLMLYFLAQRNWRAAYQILLIVFVISLLSLMIVPVQEYWSFVLAARKNAVLYLDFRTNHSLISLSEKMLGSNDGWVRPLVEAPHLAQVIGVLLTTVVTVFAYLKSKSLLAIGEDSRAFALLLCCMLLVSPISWGHYQSVLILPLGIALQDSIKMNKFAMLCFILILSSGIMSSVTDNLGKGYDQFNLPWLFSLGAYAESLGIFLLALLIVSPFKFQLISERSS